MRTIRIISKVIVGLLALSQASAWGLSAESFQIERRLNEVISTYLEPTEFLVVVRELESKKVYGADSAMVNLPGTPGLGTDEKDAKYRGYFDLDGRLQNAKARPPVQVEVVLNREVSNETKTLLRRVIPAVAGFSKEYGDKVTIKSGNLESPMRQKWESNAQPRENWIDSLVKHQKEMSSLVLGLLTALAVLILINGLLGVFRERQKGASLAGAKSSEQQPGGALSESKVAPPQIQGEKLAEVSPQSPKMKDRAPLHTRDELYHKDSAFYEMVEEIRAQALQYPERVGEVVKRWIQEGEVGVRNASILLRNFKFATVEKIMAKMVASDLNCLQSYLDLEFDFFSEQNERVMLEARQELMKIVANSGSQYQSKSMDFLGSLETHVLVELFRDEPVRTLVVASMGVPSNRLAEVLKTWPSIKQHEYFVSLVNVDRAESGEIERIQGHLKVKLQSMNQLLLTEDQKTDSIVQLLKNLSEEKQKVQVLESISAQSRSIYERVRSKVTLFQDVIDLPERAVKILTADEDPVIVARAFSRASSDAVERVKNALPKANQEIFDYELANRLQISDEQHASACASLVQKLEHLVFEKIISGYDLKRDVALTKEEAA